MKKTTLLLVLLLCLPAWSLSEVTKVVDPDNGGGTDYTSLDAWEDALGGTTTGHLPNDDQIAVAQCRSSSGTDDTTAVVIDGWTTDSTRYIKIIGTDFPSDGIYDGTKYVLNNNDSDTYFVQCQEDYVRFINLQFLVTVTPNNVRIGLYCHTLGTTDIRIDSCIFKGSCAGTGQADGVALNDASATFYIYNSTFYGFISGADVNFAGIFAANSSNTYIYNCTIYGCYYGIDRNAGTTTVKNCAVFNNTNDFDGTITIDYCASDDGDGTNAEDFTAEATDWNKVFTDYSNDDVSLKNYTTNPCCVGEGTDDPGSGLFSDDILGNARSSTWDIGAFEYVAAAGGAQVIYIN